MHVFTPSLLRVYNVQLHLRESLESGMHVMSVDSKGCVTAYSTCIAQRKGREGVD